jgi:hypothetical protein
MALCQAIFSYTVIPKYSTAIVDVCRNFSTRIIQAYSKLLCFLTTVQAKNMEDNNFET